MERIVIRVYYDINETNSFCALSIRLCGITWNTETNNLIVVHSANNSNSMLTALQPLGCSMENMGAWERITDSPRRTR